MARGMSDEKGNSHNQMIVVRAYDPGSPAELSARIRSVLSSWLVETPTDPGATMLPNGFPEDSGQENSRRDHPRLDRQAA